MRKVVKSVVLMAMVGALAMPASAAQKERSASVLQIVKKFIVRTFGDGLSDPKPKKDPGTVTTSGDLLGDPKP
jgi:hypothetical protein